MKSLHLLTIRPRREMRRWYRRLTLDPGVDAPFLHQELKLVFEDSAAGTLHTWQVVKSYWTRPRYLALAMRSHRLGLAMRKVRDVQER